MAKNLVGLFKKIGDLRDLFTTEKSSLVGAVNEIQSTTKVDSSIADVEVCGRTMVNLLGRAGNAIYKQSQPSGNTSGMEFSGDVIRAVSPSVGVSNSYIDFKGYRLKENSYYVFLFEGRNVNGDKIFHDINSVNGDRKSYNNYSTSSEFKNMWTASRTGTKVAPPYDEVYCYIAGEKGNCEAKNLRVYEITKEVYDKINVDPEYSNDKLAEKFPYVDDIKCVVNPYFENKENLVEGVPFFRGGFNPGGTTGGVDAISTTDICDGVVGDTYSLKVEGEYKDLPLQLVNRNGLTNTFYSLDKPVTLTEVGYLRLYLNKGKYPSGADDLVLLDSMNSKRTLVTLVKSSTSKSYPECHNSRLTLETKLYEGEIAKLSNDGKYYKNSMWEELDLLDNLNPVLHDNNTNTKQIRFSNVTLTRDELSSILVRYDGKILPAVLTITESEGLYGSAGSYPTNIYLSVPNNLSGWAQNYTPTPEEIRAFFLGWKMYKDPNISNLYDGVGTKCWVKLYSGVGDKVMANDVPVVLDSYVYNICPTYMNDQGYTPYRLFYKKMSPTMREVTAQGNLVLQSNSNLAVDSGLILSESTDNVEVVVDTGLCHIASYGSPLAMRVDRVVRIVNNKGLLLPFIPNKKNAEFAMVVGGSGRADIDIKYKDFMRNLSVDYLIYSVDTVSKFNYRILPRLTSSKDSIEYGIDEVSRNSQKITSLAKALFSKLSNMPVASNPNLLINGDFKVNQRSKSTYIGEAGKIIYTVDRWHLFSSGYQAGSKLEILSGNKVRISNTSKELRDTYLGQSIEVGKEMWGKHVTLSVSAISSSGFIYVNSYNAPTNAGVGPTRFSKGNIVNGYAEATLLVPHGTTCLAVNILVNGNEGSNVEINWAKLELGKVATPFTPRNYADELSSCLRYCLAYDVASYAHLGSITKVQQGFWGYIPVPSPMRVPPTILGDPESLYIDLENTRINLTSIGCAMYQVGSSLSLSAAVPPQLASTPSNQYFMIVKYPGKNLIFDSEIY